MSLDISSNGALNIHIYCYSHIITRGTQFAIYQRNTLLYSRGDICVSGTKRILKTNKQSKKFNKSINGMQGHDLTRILSDCPLPQGRDSRLDSQKFARPNVYMFDDSSMNWALVNKQREKFTAWYSALTNLGSPFHPTPLHHLHQLHSSSKNSSLLPISPSGLLVCQPEV